MLYNQTDLDNEIRELHFKIVEKRKEFDAGMKSDMLFGELREIFAEIRDLEKRLELCFQESKAQKEG